MESPRKLQAWIRGWMQDQKTGTVSLVTRRAVVTFLLMMAMALFLVAAISRMLH